MPIILSRLIIELVDAKREVDAFFDEHERNPYQTHRCEEKLSEAMRAVDDHVAALLGATSDKE